MPRGQRVQLDVPKLSSLNIENTMRAYARAFGLADQWIQALKIVGYFAYRPEGDKGIGGAEEVTLALPAPKMQAFALGAMLAPAGMWELRHEPL